jgi:hypothetical protein
MTVSSPGTDRFDLPLVDETVGDIIWIPSDTQAEAIAAYKRIGFSCVVWGGLAMEANSGR